MPAVRADVPLPATLLQHGLEVALFHAIGTADDLGFVRASPVHKPTLIQGKARVSKRQSMPNRKMSDRLKDPSRTTVSRLGAAAGGRTTDNNAAVSRGVGESNPA